MASRVEIDVHVSGGRRGESEIRRVSGALGGVRGVAARAMQGVAGLRGSLDGLAPVLGGIGRATERVGQGVAMAGTVAAGYLGKLAVDYNKTQDSQRVSFETMLKSGERAKKLMADLGDLADRSPVLDPATSGEGARQLLAFGYTAKDVLPMVEILGDAAAASGKNIQEMLPNAALVLGQIRALGKLQTQDLNQLSSGLGLGRDALAKELGMTAEQLSDEMSKGALSADKAIPAIMATLRKQSAGAAKLLSNTTAGQVDRLGEVVSRGAGTLTRGLYNLVGDQAAKLADKLGEVDFDALAKTIGGGLAKAVGWAKTAWQDLRGVIEPGLPFLQNVLWPVIKGVAIGIGASLVGAVKVLVPLLRLVFQALGAVGRVLAPLKGVFQGVGVAISFVFGGVILKAIGALGKFGGVFKIVAGAAKLVAAPIRVVTGLLGGLLGAVGAAAAALGRLGGRALPAVKAGIGKVLGFFKGLGGQFVSAGKALGGAIVRGIKGGLAAIAGIGKELYNSVARSFNNALPDKIPVPGPLPDIPLPKNPLPMLAQGGTIAGSGSVIVGDAGPEVLTLPRGARVDPLPKRGPMAPVLAGVGDRPIVTQVVLDGRVVAESVARHAARDRNRR